MPLARASVFWTDKPSREPNRWAHLFTTDRRLILAAPRIRTPVLVGVGVPAFALLGGLNLGLLAAPVVAAILFVLHRFLPWRVARMQMLPMVARCTLSVAEGMRRLDTSDLVEIRFGDGTLWRMNPLGRNGTSPAPIVTALERAGFQVLPLGG